MQFIKQNTGHAAVKGSNSQGLKKSRMLLLILVPLLLLFFGCDSNGSENSSGTASTDVSGSARSCTFGPAAETDGHRRLALVVGVGQYKKSGVPDLEGPPNDANGIYRLLTGKNGY